jgi:hypothetical protein
MDLLSPIRLGVHVATDAVKLATVVPRLILQQLNSNGHDDEQRFQPTEQERPTAATTRPVGTRPVGTRPVSARPSAPEPTSAAGASGGVAGTAAAPGDAAAASAPDPTAASTDRAARTVRQGQRRSNDVRPPRTTRVRQRTEPKRSEIDRRRVEQRDSAETPETTLAETEGSATPGATLHVDEPW